MAKTPSTNPLTWADTLATGAEARQKSAELLAKKLEASSNARTTSSSSNAATTVSLGTSTGSIPTPYSSTGAFSSTSTCTSLNASQVGTSTTTPAQPTKQKALALAAMYQAKSNASTSTANASIPPAQLTAAQAPISSSSSSSSIPHIATLPPLLTTFTMPDCDYNSLTPDHKLSEAEQVQLTQAVFDLSDQYLDNIVDSLKSLTSTLIKELTRMDVNPPLHDSDVTRLTELLKMDITDKLEQVYVDADIDSAKPQIPRAQSHVYCCVLWILKEHVEKGGVLPTTTWDAVKHVREDVKNNTVPFQLYDRMVTPLSMTVDLIVSAAARKAK